MNEKKKYRDERFVDWVASKNPEAGKALEEIRIKMFGRRNAETKEET